MGKKRKIFILSAIAAGIAIFFGRKRMKAKSEEASSGDWMPDADETAASDAVAAEDAESPAEDDSSEAAAEEEETAETTG